MKDCYEKILQKKDDEKEEGKEIAGLHWLIGGDWTKIEGGFTLQAYRYLSPGALSKLYDHGFKPKASKVGMENCFAGGVFEEELFINILKEASYELAYIFKQRGLPIGTKPGNILPAIYHSIFVPLEKEFKEYENPVNAVKKIIEHFDTEKETIIRRLVSAGLRDRNISQFDTVHTSGPTLLI